MSGFAEGTPTRTIDLNGKPHTLGWTLGAMRRARELGVLGVDAEDGIALMLALPEFVWACLLEEDREELSVAQIGELINPTNINVIGKEVGDLFRASVPKREPDPNAQPAAGKKKPTAGKKKSTSTSSGHSASST